MIEEPIWWKYAVFDDECNVIGLNNEATEEAKEAYKEDMAELQTYIDNNEPIPK